MLPSVFRSAALRDLDLDAGTVQKDPWLRALGILADRIRLGQCLIQFPDGSTRPVDSSVEPGLRAVLRLNDTRAARRLILGGSLGFAEAYLDGAWDSPDLTGLLELALRNEKALGTVKRGAILPRLMRRIGHWANANTRRGSRRNIAHHYDLSNDFYRLWLDPTMTYSSALFTSLDETLEDGQRAKYRHLATLLDLKAGQEVLEVGCGWGAFALMAAREYGCRVTGITLSREQAAFARQRVAEEGLADRIDIRYQDYRDVTGRYDRIASIEMFEAVGERYWPRFFHLLDGWLKPGGVAAMQVITIEEARFPAYRRNTDFIQHYIFPGGMLPTPTALRREIGKAGLRPTAMVSFGSSYGRTLKLWHQAFQGNWPRIRELGFSERFKRMWEYYLAYCEAGFRAGSIDVGQWRIERSAAAQPPA